VLYDAIETFYAVLVTNFQTDWATLCTAKSVGAPETITIRKRYNADLLYSLGVATPALGIYGTAATTQAKMQGQRLSIITVGVDWFHRTTLGSDQGSLAAVLLAQSELAAEAILLSVDRLATAGASVWGAGERENSVSITASGGYEEGESGTYQRLVTVTVPVRDSDEV
jgi:malonyl CoA-acyl carrier protein transacylase